MDEVQADDGCRLWTEEAGRGEPLLMCHGGPGLWDMSGSLAATPLIPLTGQMAGHGDRGTPSRGSLSLPNPPKKALLSPKILPGNRARLEPPHRRPG